MASQKSQELVSYLVHSLVENPDDVKINFIPGGRTSVVELSVHSDDMGRIIGKGGSRANAIRTLLSVVSSKENHNYELEILN